MTAVAADQSLAGERLSGTAAAPCLTAAPWAGRIITILFVVTIVLFALAILTLGPVA